MFGALVENVRVRYYAAYALEIRPWQGTKTVLLDVGRLTDQNKRSSQNQIENVVQNSGRRILEREQSKFYLPCLDSPARFADTWCIKTY